MCLCSVFFFTLGIVCAEFPDDPRFRLYKIFRKHEIKSCLAYRLEDSHRFSFLSKNSNFSYQTMDPVFEPLYPLSTKLLISIHCSKSLGGENVRAGTRTAASGTVVSEAGKKALGEGLDCQLAELKSSKSGKTPKEKTKKDRSKEEEDAKRLQKTIKAFLISIHHVWFKIVQYTFYVGFPFL